MYPVNDIQTDQPLYIQELQLYLRQLSRAYPHIPALNPDGIFGAATGRAVEIFQRRFGLPMTRKADLVTWDTIFTEYRRMKSRNPYDGSVPPPSDPMPLAQGTRCASVAQLNAWLNQLHHCYDALSPCGESEEFGPDTTRAVSRMQQILMLPVNGIVEYPTWRGIAQAARLCCCMGDNEN